MENQYKEGVDVGAITELKNMRDKLLERAEDLKVEYTMCAHGAISNRITELYEVIEIIQNRVYELSPSDCDW